jgi:hypothetical protein
MITVGLGIFGMSSSGGGLFGRPVILKGSGALLSFRGLIETERGLRVFYGI